LRFPLLLTHAVSNASVPIRKNQINTNSGNLTTLRI